MTDEEPVDQTAGTGGTESVAGRLEEETPEAGAGGSALSGDEFSQDAEVESSCADPLFGAAVACHEQQLFESPAGPQDSSTVERPPSLPRLTDTSAYDDPRTLDSAVYASDTVHPDIISTLETCVESPRREMNDWTPSPVAPVEPQRDEFAAKTADTPATATRARQYVCLDCGYQSETFLGGCSDCGGTEFETTASPAGPGPELDDTALGVLATLTARFNPYVPR